MSKIINIPFTCSTCNKEYDIPYWQSLNSAINKEETEKLLNGTFFDTTCPHCGATTTVNYPILYHDQLNSAMVYLLPAGNDEDVKKAVALFDQQQNLKNCEYEFRIVKNHNELREKALLFHHHMDDRVWEIIKIIYLIQMQKKHPDVEIADIYYLRDEKGEHTLCFIATDGTQYYATVDEGLYNEVGSDYNDAIKASSANCYEINRTWAQGLLFDNN